VSARLARLRGLLEAPGLDALVVNDGANLRYVTGFTSSDAVALVGADGTARFFTDFRYKEQSEAEVDPAFSREIVDQGLLGDLVPALPPGRVGFDDANTSVAELRTMSEAVDGAVELVPAGGIVEDMRVVKDADELERIAAAAELVDGIYEWLVERGFAGRRERDVVVELEHEMRLRGALTPSFPSIVAAGARAALPHAQPRAATIEPGTLVIVDIGAVLDGYCSDCTRTFAVGEPSQQAREIYELVLATQLRGLDAVRAGRRGVDIDADARALIADAGYAEYYGHGLGHGVGLEIHERPRLSYQDADEVLQVGTVVTVEPGVYLPDALGVRIEDLTVVTGSEPRRLSQFTKELLVVD
jgi:Xaa-Pro aminopeptidase